MTTLEVRKSNGVYTPRRVNPFTGAEHVDHVATTAQGIIDYLDEHYPAGFTARWIAEPPAVNREPSVPPHHGSRLPFIPAL